VKLLIALGPVAKLPVPEKKEPKREKGQLVIWVIPPPNPAEKNLANLTVPAAATKKRHPVGEGVDLTGLVIEIEDAPGFEMLDLLAEEKGCIGFGESPESHMQSPVAIVRCFSYSEFQEEKNCGTTDDYFPVKLNQSWPELERFRTREGIVAGLQAYALFPSGFGRCVRDAIRKEAIGRSIAVVSQIVLRFVKIADGFEVLLP
jgi:hypothetical protein